MPYKQVIPVIDYKVRALCVKEYPGHKKGCPNFNKKDGCPPQVKFFDTIYDVSKPVYAIWNIFNLQEHIDKLKIKHPDWTYRQLTCCLYWQPKARKSLLSEIKAFKRLFSNLSVTTCPEGMGVNITATMLNIGEVLEWPPQGKTYQIALAGNLIKDNNINQFFE